MIVWSQKKVKWPITLKRFPEVQPIFPPLCFQTSPAELTPLLQIRLSGVAGDGQDFGLPALQLTWSLDGCDSQLLKQINPPKVENNICGYSFRVEIVRFCASDKNAGPAAVEDCQGAPITACLDLGSHITSPKKVFSTWGKRVEVLSIGYHCSILFTCQCQSIIHMYFFRIFRP